jgi:hypothetical protein
MVSRHCAGAGNCSIRVTTSRIHVAFRFGDVARGGGSSPSVISAALSVPATEEIASTNLAALP